MSHLLLSVMGAFAQFERDLIRERQREGIALANCAKAHTSGESIRSHQRRQRNCGDVSLLGSRKPRSPASWVSAVKPSIGTLQEQGSEDYPQRVMHCPCGKREGACVWPLCHLLHAEKAGRGVFRRPTRSGSGARRLPMPRL